jgi:hypothetical protein
MNNIKLGNKRPIREEISKTQYTLRVDVSNHKKYIFKAGTVVHHIRLVYEDDDGSAIVMEILQPAGSKHYMRITTTKYYSDDAIMSVMSDGFIDIYKPCNAQLFIEEIA